MVRGWHLDGRGRYVSTPKNPVKVGETEKITINLGLVDLGQIDLLVPKASTPTAPT